MTPLRAEDQVQAAWRTVTTAATHVVDDRGAHLGRRRAVRHPTGHPAHVHDRRLPLRPACPVGPSTSISPTRPAWSMRSWPGWPASSWPAAKRRCVPVRAWPIRWAEAAVFIRMSAGERVPMQQLPADEDQLLATLMTASSRHLTDEWVDFWLPFLEDAEGRGEIRSGLDYREVGEWIVRLLMSFAVDAGRHLRRRRPTRRPEFRPDLRSCRIRPLIATRKGRRP